MHNIVLPYRVSIILFHCLFYQDLHCAPESPYNGASFRELENRTLYISCITTLSTPYLYVSKHVSVPSDCNGIHTTIHRFTGRPKNYQMFGPTCYQSRNKNSTYRLGLASTSCSAHHNISSSNAFEKEAPPVFFFCVGLISSVATIVRNVLITRVTLDLTCKSTLPMLRESHLVNPCLRSR